MSVSKKTISRFVEISLLVALPLMVSNVVFAQPVVVDRKKAATLVAHGDELMVRKEYVEAGKSYEQAHIYDPTNALILLKLGQVSEKKGDLSEAIDSTRKATEVEPYSFAAHMQLAKYLETDRETKGAILQYERALELTQTQSTRVPIFLKLASLLIDNGDIKEADRLSQRWVKENENNAECHFIRGHVLSKLQKEPKLKEADHEFMKCLRIDPTVNLAHYELGKLRGQYGDKPGAIMELKAFINGKPTEKYLNLAQNLLKTLEDKPPVTKAETE